MVLEGRSVLAKSPSPAWSSLDCLTSTMESSQGSLSRGHSEMVILSTLYLHTIYLSSGHCEMVWWEAGSWRYSWSLLGSLYTGLTTPPAPWQLDTTLTSRPRTSPPSWHQFLDKLGAGFTGGVQSVNWSSTRKAAPTAFF